MEFGLDVAGELIAPAVQRVELEVDLLILEP